jgi:hypothetical protein
VPAVSRVTVYHLTEPRRLPLIEEEGLRTRAELSSLLGEPGELDRAAPGTFAHGKRVSAYHDLDAARMHVAEHGPGLISYSVDPRKTLAAPASLRDGDPEAYWEAAKPLAAWLDEGDVPTDLEVHQNVPVRAKYLALHAPLLDDEALGDYAGLVAEVADEDRLSAKALMHLAIIASEGDFTSPEFLAACALAWRDEPDRDDLIRELVETDPDKVASAALAMYGADSPDGVAKLRETLDETRTWGDQNGVEHGQALFARTALVLDELETA